MVRLPLHSFIPTSSILKRPSSFLPLPNTSSFTSTKFVQLKSQYKPPSSPITSLETSLSPRDTIPALRRHSWTTYDFQYLILAIINIFSLSIISMPGPIFKTILASSILASLVVPITRQFFLPVLPILTWLVLFYSCRFISPSWRPPISVTLLPTLENILYGSNLSQILSKHMLPLLDVLAWLPYGIVHFGAPFVCAIVLFVAGPPGTLPVYAKAFGYMNVVGVLLQLIFPCSPPWYENLFGLAPANYSMSGSPGGLSRIDNLLGLSTYTSTFTASPMVFGAFPSLHAGCASIEALFLQHAFPNLRAVLIGYVCWIWWATMYLTHHYFVDLIGGSCLAVAAFYIAERNFLPQIQEGKRWRWDYEFVEFAQKTRKSRANSRALERVNGDVEAAWQELDTMRPLPVSETAKEEDEGTGPSGSTTPMTTDEGTPLESIWDGNSNIMRSDEGSITTVWEAEDDSLHLKGIQL